MEGAKHSDSIRKKRGINGILILLASVSLTIVIVVLLYLIYTKKIGPKVTENLVVNTIEKRIRQKSSWSNPTDVPGTDNGQARTGCKLYEFTYPETASYIKSQVDRIKPSNSNRGCLLSNQIYARLRQRVCQGGGDQGFGCVGSNGESFPPGSNELYYEPCPLDPCKADISLISIPHVSSLNSEFPAGLCITKNEGSIPGFLSTIALPCDRENGNQSLFIQRYNLDETKNPTGPLAVVQDSRTGLCLEPDANGILGFYPCTTDKPKWGLIPSKSFGLCGGGHLPIDTDNYPVNSNSTYCNSANLKARYVDSKSSGLPCFFQGSCQDKNNNNIPGTVMSNYAPAKILPQQLLYIDSFITDFSIFTNPMKFQQAVSTLPFRTAQLELNNDGTYVYKLKPMALDSYRTDVNSQILDIYSFDSTFNNDVPF